MSSDYTFLIQTGLITTNDTYICKNCVETYTNKNTTQQIMSTDDSDPSHCSYDSQCFFPDEILEKLGKEVREDCRLLYHERPCSDIDKLISFNSRDWLIGRPKNLVKFLSLLCSLNLNNEIDVIKLCMIIEQMYGCINQRMILPNSFRNNLLTYSLSNSKLLVNFNGKCRPSGGYTFLKNWLANQAKDELKVPIGIVKIVFDNEQVVGKEYTVKSDSNVVPMSVVTSHIYVSIDQKNTAQNLIDLKPEQWMFNGLTDVQMEKIMNFTNSYNVYFRNSRNRFIEKRIDIILKQQQVGINCTDFVDDMIKKNIESKTLKSCNKCDKKWDIKLRVCKVCHSPLEHIKLEIPELRKYLSENYNPYNHFDIHMKMNNIKV